MSIPAQIALAFGSVAALLVLMALTRQLARTVGLSAEVQRKLMHVGTGLFALTFPWLFPDRWPVYMLVAATFAVMLVLRMPAFSRGIGATLHGVERRSYGDFLLALSVGLCFFFAGDNTLLYVLPIAVLTLADAAAALAGTTYGTRHFVVEDGSKSIEGSAVFFVIALLIALVCFLLLSDLPAPNILALSLMLAAFGTLVEAQSWSGFDNLFLPMGLLVFLAIHGQSSLPELAILAAIFLAAIIVARNLGPRIGLSRQAARVYVIATFLVLAVTAPQNAVLPIAALAAHLWARAANPTDSTHPDLEIVAAIGLVSFGWLALGNGSGWNAVAFYGVTMAGMATAFAACATRNLLVVPAFALALAAIHTAVTALNPPAANWAAPLWPLALITLAVCAALPALRPTHFARDRVRRITLLALALPLVTFLVSILGRSATVLESLNS